MKKSMDQIISEIASSKLSIDTLDTRNSDEYDFHEVSVWGLKAALESAFNAGKNPNPPHPRQTVTPQRV